MRATCTLHIVKVCLSISFKARVSAVKFKSSALKVIIKTSC